LSQFVYQHDDIKAAFEAFQADTDNWVDKLFAHMGLDAPCSSHDCLTAYAERMEWQIVRDLAQALSQASTATNQKAGEAFLGLFTTWHNEGRFDFEALKGIFFTQKGEPRKSPYTKETSPGDAIALDRLAREVTALAEQAKAADIASDTLDALRLFTVFSYLYTDRKVSEAALDFQDLINKTRELLTRADMAAWVLFKLDGGLDHILVDEAQDTSDDQWAIVRALADEFFAGLGQAEGQLSKDRDARPRTAFAVGDEKQSIYGFQGAKPDLFLENRDYFRQSVTHAGGRFVEPELVQSWRTLPRILGFVDAVYDNADWARALNFTGHTIVHEARRTEAEGCVELWPLVRTIDAPDLTADDDEEIAALDQVSTAHPAKRLAQQLSATIRQEIDAGRSVFDKSTRAWRPMHAGDVLILVRKRDVLFEHIIRELKQAGVAVSGADRLKLGEHIAFQDLRALMRFSLQPRDDLSLACVLRSPLCSLTEDDLYGLAYGRTGTLWHALIDKGGDSGPFAEARVFLAWAVKAAANLPAFDFLARVLNRRDDAGRSMKQRFLTRLGDECEDVLDETLALALKGENAGATGLAAVLDLFEFNASEIKREQEEGGRSVRVMTVHGSKGLEAPWVILPFGPNHGPGNSADLLMMGPEGLYLCAGGKSGDTAGITALRAAKAMRDDQESLRLLYVALTRARDRLTLCGYAGKKVPRTGNFPSWYDLCENAFNAMDGVSTEWMALKAPFDESEQSEEVPIRLYGARNAVMSAQAHVPAAKIKLPAFVTAPVPVADVELERWTAISQMGDDERTPEDRAPSPLQATGQLGRYRRGNLIHKLFEILPEISPAARDEVAARYLLRQADLTEDQRDEMRGAVMTVLEDARFAEAFGPASRPEVALAGQIGVNDRGEALMLSGRIDRLVVTPDRVLIIDYKSNRPAPDRAENAAIAYQRQMAGYVALLRQVYPERTVESALLWTDGPKLTPLSDALVNLRLAEIAAR
jgi:ATP-dependent helicase/nuclease subunit A